MKKTGSKLIISLTLSTMLFACNSGGHNASKNDANTQQVTQSPSVKSSLAPITSGYRLKSFILAGNRDSRSFLSGGGGQAAFKDTTSDDLAKFHKNGMSYGVDKLTDYFKNTLLKFDGYDYTGYLYKWTNEDAMVNDKQNHLEVGIKLINGVKAYPYLMKLDKPFPFKADKYIDAGFNLISITFHEVLEYNNSLNELGAVYMRLKILEEKGQLSPEEQSDFDALGQYIYSWVGEMVYQLNQLSKGYNEEAYPFLSMYEDNSDSLITGSPWRDLITQKEPVYIKMYRDAKITADESDLKSDPSFEWTLDRAVNLDITKLKQKYLNF